VVRPDGPRWLLKVPAWVPLAVMLAIVLGLAIDAARSFLFQGRQGDFIHFYEAARVVAGTSDNPDPAKRTDIYLSHIQWYSYPPMLAVVLAPLGFLTLGQAGAIWALCNAAMISVILWFVSAEVLRRFEVERTIRNIGTVAVFAAIVMADKIRAEMRLGQSDGPVMLGMFGALLFLGRQPLLSGLLLGLAANVKYQTLVVLPYLIVRRRWTETSAAIAAAAAIALSSALVFGWQKNLEYLDRAFNGLKFVVGAIEKDRTGPDLFPLYWERSVSLTSTLARGALLRSGARDLSDNKLELTNADKLFVVGGMGILAAACLGLAWWMFAKFGIPFWKGRGGRADDRTPRRRAVVCLEWAGLVAGVLAFSPQTTSRHMILVIFLAVVSGAVVCFGSWASGAFSRAGKWALAGVIVGLLGLVLPPGGGSMETAQQFWRGIGGPTWCILFMFFTTLFAALDWCRRLPDSGEDPHKDVLV
jgi:hypothetical protein